MSILNKKDVQYLDFTKKYDDEAPQFRIANSVKLALKRMDNMMRNYGRDSKRVKTELETVVELDDKYKYNMYKVRCIYKILAYDMTIEIELIEYAYDNKYAKEFYEE